jgi:hypothetical protein
MTIVTGDFMTRDKENELLARRRKLRQKSNVLIQRIVDARIGGHRDAEAIRTLGELSREEVEMTRPDLTLAA